MKPGRRSTWKLWVASAGVFVSLVLIDGQLWRIARLSRYIGKQEGVSGAVDDSFVNYFGASLKRQELEDALAKTRDPEEAGAISRELFKLLGDSGSTMGQRNLMIEMVQRYPGNDSPDIITAHEYLAEYYLKSGQSAELLKILKLLLPIAEADPPDAKMLSRIVRWACKGRLNDLIEDVGPRALAMPAVPPETKLAIATTLIAFYNAAGNAERVKEIKAIKQECRKSVDLVKLVKSRSRSIDKLMKDKKWREAEQELLQLCRDFPQLRLILMGLAGRIARNAVMHDKSQILHRMWGIFKDVPVHTANKNLVKNAVSLMGILVPWRLRNADTTRELTAISRTLQDIPGLQDDLGYYVKGEIWARSKSSGQPPKKYYVVRFKPNAMIKLDGILDEPVYKQLKAMPGDYWLHAGGKTSLLKAPDYIRPVALLFYTRTDLFVAITLPEPDMAMLKPGPGPGPVKSPWNSDCVELYIDFERRLGNYQQWIVDANAGFKHLYLYGGYKEYTNKGGGEGDAQPMTCAAAHNPRSYIIEMRIPLSQFPIKGDLSGKLMNANIRRLRYLSRGMKVTDAYAGKRMVTISWARLGYGHNTEKFDFIRFE